MINKLIFIIYKSLNSYNKSFKLISSFNLISLFIISISYILLSVSLINKSNLLIKIKSINNIISFNIKLNKRVV